MFARCKLNLPIDFTGRSEELLVILISVDQDRIEIETRSEIRLRSIRYRFEIEPRSIRDPIEIVSRSTRDR